MLESIFLELNQYDLVLLYKKSEQMSTKNIRNIVNFILNENQRAN